LIIANVEKEKIMALLGISKCTCNKYEKILENRSFFLGFRKGEGCEKAKA
jgi:hypothetical protein